MKHLLTLFFFIFSVTPVLASERDLSDATTLCVQTVLKPDLPVTRWFPTAKPLGSTPQSYWAVHKTSEVEVQIDLDARTCEVHFGSITAPRAYEMLPEIMRKARLTGRGENLEKVTTPMFDGFRGAFNMGSPNEQPVEILVKRDAYIIQLPAD